VNCDVQAFHAELYFLGVFIFVLYAASF